MMQLAECKRRQAPTHASTERSPSTPSARSPVSPLALRSPIIQPQLTVNQPGDRYEQEADAVARAVMSGTPERSQPTSGQATIQRLAEEDQDVLQRQTLEEAPVQRLEEDQDVLQRQTLDETPVQRQGNGQPAVSARTAATIRNPGTGAPLPASTRRRIEPHVGANLSGVRVHSDANAHRAANSLQARAFTHGQHIFLNRSESSHNLSLMAHEATHVVQQGAAPIQRQPSIQRVPAIEHSPKGSSHPPEIQRFIPDAVLEELADYARYIPGYTLFTVIIGYDPLRGVDVERNATNLLEGLMGLVPFGTAIFDALQEYGVIQAAFDWLSGELRRLDLSLSRIERTIEDAWDDVRLIEGFDYNLAVVQRHFQRLYDDVVDFATSLVNHIIELIKEAAIEFAEPLLADNRAWALIKKIIKYDPLRDVPVEATTVEILEDFLVLIGKEQELEQMRERGTLQETADWLDTQFALFVSLIGQLRGLITEAWNAIQPENLPDLGTNLENLAEGVGTFLEDVWTFASTVALKVLELIKNALLGWLSTFANDIPGFHLLTVILEQNPFTQEAVPRNATNLIRGFMSLMPGGERQFQQMQETGVIPQAAQRIEGMMTELGITWPFVQRLFLDLWDAFTIDDLLSPIDAFTRILDEFREPLNRLFTFVIEVIKVALELILALMNFPTDLIGSIITNALQALDDIQRDPVGFLINLLNTAKLGFQKFFDNILEHLIGGLTNWLFRTVREAGIEPPADLSFESILGFVLEVLGLTMDHMWELLANHIGQERVDQIRGMIDRVVELARDAWGFIQDVQERGIVAVWEYIQSQLTNLWDVVLEQVQSYVMERVVIVGMRWLLSLLDATGITPVINSFIAFFNAIQSAIEYLRDMLEVVNDFVSTVASIAAGDIEPGATRMEQGLGNSIPIVIGFIANQLGLGNISERLGEIIESIRAMVDRALNWLIEQALRLGRAVLNNLGFGDGSPSTSADQGGAGDLSFAAATFSMHRAGHTIRLEKQGGEWVILMSSASVGRLLQKLINAKNDAEQYVEDPQQKRDIVTQLDLYYDRARAISQKSGQLEAAQRSAPNVPAGLLTRLGIPNGEPATLDGVKTQIDGDLGRLAGELEVFGNTHDIVDLMFISTESRELEVATHEDLSAVNDQSGSDPLTSDHQPQDELMKRVRNIVFINQNTGAREWLFDGTRIETYIRPKGIAMNIRQSVHRSLSSSGDDGRAVIRRMGPSESTSTDRRFFGLDDPNAENFAIRANSKAAAYTIVSGVLNANLDETHSELRPHYTARASDFAAAASRVKRANKSAWPQAF
jgi:phage-related protein